MAHSNKWWLSYIQRMTAEQLVSFIASQEEIDRRCKNPLPQNKTLHDRYTNWAREELARRRAVTDSP
jgi:hypothetical protein